jgi:cysteine desulfurase/selenocysteine lyase
MSTSDPRLTGVPAPPSTAGAPGLEQAFAAAAGVMPELTAIANLANEFFKAGSAATTTGGASGAVPQWPALAEAPTQAATAVPMPSVSSLAPTTASGASLPGVGELLYVVDEASRQLANTTRAASAASRFDLSPVLVPDLHLAAPIFDPVAIRRDFPILREMVHGRPLVWLDNAATTQKPQAVIDRIAHFYAHENSNVHRAAHAMAARATDAFEGAREAVRRFLHAPSAKDIVFVRGATEGINLVAKSWGVRHVQQGDEIALTVLEHHSNIVPWQQLAADRGATIRVVPVDDHGQILLDEYERLLSQKTRIVALAHVSNALGTITPVAEMVALAHRHGARVLVDGAQAVSHMPVDVQALDADFYVFSGHKVFGPTGIGAVYGKPDVLTASPPWQGGGNMIQDVTFERTVYQPPPMRFEAGTGNIADAVGLGAALDYLQRIGLENVARYEHELLAYATDGLCEIPGLHLVGTAPEKAGVMSFTLDDFRSEDVGAALDRDGIAVRSGHHCAQPALRRFGLETSVRPSLAVYNTRDDVDALVASLKRLTAASARTFSLR